MKENKPIIIVTLLNFVVFIIKLITGIMFSFSSLIADSIQSFVDFFTDIISLVANKVGKRRANKTYPFGYGQVYYLANCITGILLFLIGLLICIEVIYFKNHFEPKPIIFVILFAIILTKILVVSILKHYSHTYNSELLIESAKESIADLISTLVVLGILTLSSLDLKIFANIDKIGCIGMAIYVFWTSIKMLISNINGLLMNDEENTDIKGQIINDLKVFEDFVPENIRVIKMSSYYSVFLQVKFKENIKIKKYLRIEKKIKKLLKSKNRQIRFIDIEPV